MNSLPATGNPPEFHITAAIHHCPTAPSSPTAAASHHFSLDFSFHSGDHPPEISTADKLFEKGKIRPLHPPQSTDRGRQKNPSFSSPNSNIIRQRQSRSLSPLRNHSFTKTQTLSPPSSSLKKWRLKDLLLFRSASEGRATTSGYTLLSSLASFSSKIRKKGEEEECKCGSFRSNGSCGGSMRRASAHEMHYRENRVMAGEKRKMTPLAYQRQGLFSCLQFNPAIRSISKGFSSFS